MGSKLAIRGGAPVIDRPFTPYSSYGEEELQAATEVIRSGTLSGFYGSWIPSFFGGPRVKAFEADWSRHFEVPHAVSVNSATSGLIAAVGAIGVEPGDEVIVTPLTMSATATAIMVWNAIPVFSDVQRTTFTLDPTAIEARITDRTKAIVVTDIFGHAAEMDEIMAIAARRGLKVIEDAAQAPGAQYRGRYAGALADIGVYSLNYHKHIHTGEGGMCVTADAKLAERMQMIRNHAENVVAPKKEENLVNMIGFNFRLGEIEAAMGSEQLKKLPRLVQERQRAAERLTAGLHELRGLTPPQTLPDCTHVYYVYPLLIDPDTVGHSKKSIVAALEAEGVPGLAPAFSNLHLLPMYQKRIAYGSKGYPWVSAEGVSAVTYDKGICPIAEDLRDASLFGIQTCMHEFSAPEVDLVIEAFHKVWGHLDEL
jgi:dTDP-4-amino-4,6-dideoxygalactose transaminase